MTKERLEQEFEYYFDANTRATGGGYEADTTDMNGLWRSFSPKVFEFAKQQAIAFDIWKIKNHWLWDNDRCIYFKREEDLCMTYLTHEEVYNKFIEQ